MTQGFERVGGGWGYVSSLQLMLFWFSLLRRLEKFEGKAEMYRQYIAENALGIIHI